MPGVSYKGLCPFCGTDHVDFRAHFAWTNLRSDHRAVFKCGFCGEGVVRAYTFAGSTVDVAKTSGDASVYKINLGDQWPESRSADAPSDCPANVSSFFKQAASSLNSANFDASGMMFRKALEAATKSLNPSSKAKDLAGRVKELVDSNALTGALGGLGE